jgi:hypothetical protein
LHRASAHDEFVWTNWRVPIDGCLVVAVAVGALLGLITTPCLVMANAPFWSSIVFGLVTLGLLIVPVTLVLPQSLRITEEALVFRRRGPFGWRDRVVLHPDQVDRVVFGAMPAQGEIDLEGGRPLVLFEVSTEAWEEKFPRGTSVLRRLLPFVSPEATTNWPIDAWWRPSVSAEVYLVLRDLLPARGWTTPFEVDESGARVLEERS